MPKVTPWDDREAAPQLKGSSSSLPIVNTGPPTPVRQVLRAMRSASKTFAVRGGGLSDDSLRARIAGLVRRRAELETIGTPWMWAGFAAFVLAALAVDLRLMKHGGPHRVTTREALAWSVFWIAVAMAFNAALWWWPEHGNIEFYKRCTLTLGARNAPLLHTSSRGSGVPLVLNWNTQSAGLSFVSVAEASRQMRAPSQIEKRCDNRGARCKRLQGPGFVDLWPCG